MKSTLLNDLPENRIFKLSIYSLSLVIFLRGIYLGFVLQEVPTDTSLEFIFGGISLLAVYSLWLKYIQSDNKKMVVYFGILLSSSLIIINAIIRHFRETNILPIRNDIALFEHAGWLITTQKYIPYLNIWDIKPPMIYYLTSALSFFSGGNISLLHIFSVVVSIAISMGSIIIIYKIIMLKTKDHLSALISVLMMLSFTFYNILAVEGLRAKYPSAFFGLLSIYFVLKHASLLSGIMGGLAVWFYLPAGIFLIISLIIVYQQNKAGLSKVILGSVISTIIVMIPFLFWGWDAFNAMLLEVFIGPTAGQGNTDRNKLLLLFRGLKYNLIFIGFVFVGLYKTVFPNLKIYWEIIAAIGFGIFALFLDLDGIPDIIIPYILFALSLGTILSASSFRLRKGVIVLGVFLSVVSVTWQGSLSNIIIKPANIRVTRIRPPNAFDRETPNTVYMFLNSYIPERCHYRLSPVENLWIKKEKLDVNAKICGFAEYPEIDNFGEYIIWKIRK